MSDIYNILGLVLLFLLVGYLILTIITTKKKTFCNNINVIKTRIAFTSVLMVLFAIKMITALSLGRSIVSELSCAIVWAILTAIGYRDLKNSKRAVNYDNIIDG